MCDHPVQALIVLCHPNRSGFNHVIAQAAQQELQKSHHVHFIDLYRTSFNPVLPYQEISRRFSFEETTLNFYHLVQEANVLVFIHPDWWGGPPSLLKGFIDCVFRPGVAYDFHGSNFLSTKKIGLLADKKALVFNTTDYAEPDAPYPPAEIWKTNIFSYCGIDDAQVHTFFNTYHSTYEARHSWISDVGPKIRQHIS